MEPLFINRTTLDEATMAEWFKAEYARSYRGWRWLALAAVVLYLALAAVVWVAAFTLGSLAMGLLGGLFVLLAVVFVAVLALRPRRQLKKLLRESVPREPVSQLALFFPDAALPISGPAAEEEGAAASAAKRVGDAALQAASLKSEFELAMQVAQMVEDGDTGGLALLRDELDSLQGRMDAFTKDAALLDTMEGCAWRRLTGWYPTERLFVLQYGERLLLVARDGFEQGNAQDFTVFLAARLAEAEARRSLEPPEAKKTKMRGRRNKTRGG